MDGWTDGWMNQSPLCSSSIENYRSSLSLNIYHVAKETGNRKSGSTSGLSKALETNGPCFQTPFVQIWKPMNSYSALYQTACVYACVWICMDDSARTTAAGAVPFFTPSSMSLLAMGACPWPRDRALNWWLIPEALASCSSDPVGSTPGDSTKIRGLQLVDSSTTCHKTKGVRKEGGDNWLNT